MAESPVSHYVGPLTPGEVFEAGQSVRSFSAQSPESQELPAASQILHFHRRLTATEIFMLPFSAYTNGNMASGEKPYVGFSLDLKVVPYAPKPRFLVASHNVPDPSLEGDSTLFPAPGGHRGMPRWGPYVILGATAIDVSVRNLAQRIFGPARSGGDKYRRG